MNQAARINRDLASARHGVGPLGLATHPLRGQVLGEVHARPVQPIESPARLIRLAFINEVDKVEAARQRFTEFCLARGVDAPALGRRHHVIRLGSTWLRYEQHAEITTFTWGARGPAGALALDPFRLAPDTVAEGLEAIGQPGPLIAAVDLAVTRNDESLDWRAFFAAESLAAASVEDGGALIATDFQASGEGFVRVLLMEQGLDAVQLGTLAQRLLEIETYRLLALLALPEAQRLAPKVLALEERLSSLTRDMTRAQGLEANKALLDRLSDLAAELEADSAASTFRFSATRAYMGLVQDRLTALGERPLRGLPTLDGFLDRRLVPAMRTVQATEDRMGNLSQRIARAANLLRTRVDVELEEQNRSVLTAMNERARMQLRLQRTVEGLSIAAVSYYVVGLILYMARAAADLGWGPNPALVTALAVPAVVAAVALFVSRLRKHFTE